MTNHISLSDMQLRLQRIIDYRYPKRGAFTTLSSETGISAAAWNHVFHGRNKPTGEHLEHICRLFPEYTLWLMTGKTALNAGQTSPDIEQLEKLKSAVEEE